MSDAPASNPVPPAGPTRRLHPVVFVLFVLFSYWLYGYRPIASYPDSGVDDGLYLRHGQAFVAWLYGQHPLWLGDYDCFLLSKAPLYGLFLGVLNLLCIPIRVAEFLLFLGMPWLFASACRPLVDLRGWRFLLACIILVWLPFLPSETHLLRNALQAILTSYLTIASLGLVLRWRAERADQWGWAALIGLLFSLNYLNREEAAWVAFVALASVGLFAALGWFHDRRLPWRRSLEVAGIIAVCATPLILAVAALNYRSYGVFITTFRRSDAFTAAFQRLTSLEPESRKAYIPIARATRMRAYDLSPTFAKLKPIMEGNSTYWVAGIDDHSSINGYSPADKEFFISNYEFALQYAVSVTDGRTAPEAERMFAAIASELSAAVAAGKIKAGSHGPAILAAPRPGDFGRILRATWNTYWQILLLRRGQVNWGDQSRGQPADLERASLFVHWTFVPENQQAKPYVLRHAAAAAINPVLRAIYWAAVPLLLVSAGLLAWRRRSLLHPGTVAAIIPLASVGLFCLTMAIIDTLGFPHLALGMGYIVLGYSPLSVLAAFGLVLAIAFGRERRGSQAPE